MEQTTAPALRPLGIFAMLTMLIRYQHDLEYKSKHTSVLPGYISTNYNTKNTYITVVPTKVFLEIALVVKYCASMPP